MTTNFGAAQGEPTQGIRIVTLGTAGGPQWWRQTAPGEIRAGISTAIVVGDDVYLVDAGYGAAVQLARAGYSLGQVRAVFVTHLHSDHTVDLPAIMLFSLYEAAASPHLPIPVIGPAPHPGMADKGGLPRGGTAGLMRGIEAAFADDLFDRMEYGLRQGLDAVWQAREIAPAAHEVYRDEHVAVTAASVDHGSMQPAYAFRFDTSAGSVTISGDTAPCKALTDLARGTDLLLHEAIDDEWLTAAYPPDAEATDVQRASLAHHRESHTTTADACRMADEAGAARLVLHHLVPGNTPAEVWRQQATRHSGSVEVAADLGVYHVPG
ncbi:MBL fold metallo-hydrolase [Leucobacter sp. HY1908]